jgi:hypothetical protein
LNLGRLCKACGEPVELPSALILFLNRTRGAAPV